MGRVRGGEGGEEKEGEGGRGYHLDKSAQ